MGKRLFLTPTVYFETDGTNITSSQPFNIATNNIQFTGSTSIYDPGAVYPLFTYTALTGLSLKVDANETIKLAANNVLGLTVSETALTAGLPITMNGQRMLYSQPTGVASANNLTLTNGNDFSVTGTTQVNLLDSTNWTTGSRIYIVFAGALTVKHNQTPSSGFKAILLKDELDFVTEANDGLLLRYNGTAWVEIQRREQTPRIRGKQGADVASATNVTLGKGNSFIITGTTTINTIVTTGWRAGSVIYLRYANGLSVTNGAGGNGQFFNQTGLGTRVAAAGSEAVYVLKDISGTLYWRELSYIA